MALVGRVHSEAGPLPPSLGPAGDRALLLLGATRPVLCGVLGMEAEQANVAPRVESSGQRWLGSEEVPTALQAGRG